MLSCGVSPGATEETLANPAPNPKPSFPGVPGGNGSTGVEGSPGYRGRMPVYDSDIASVAALLADRGRAAMLTALLGGRPLSAGELAQTAQVTPQTASAHLARLLDGGLVTVVKQGRHRYYELAGPQIAEVLEALSGISPPIEVRSLKQSTAARALQAARTCYDHLAGQAGVGLFGALCDNEYLDRDSCLPTPEGESRLGMIGVDLAVVRTARRRLSGTCLDWTERRPHLSGALGAAVLTRAAELGWFRPGNVPRALVLTERGVQGLQEVFGCQITGPVPVAAA